MNLLSDNVDLSKIQDEKKKIKLAKEKKISEKLEKAKIIHSLNSDKSKLNLCKLSRWLHIFIMDYLDVDDIVMLGTVC